MRPRFSIARLLAVIALLALAFASLRSPSYLWANVTFSAAFAVLVLAVLNAVYARGASRAYWVGFAACGGAFFAACWMPGIRGQMVPRLVTEVGFDMLYPLLAPPPPNPNAAPPAPAPPAPAGGMLTVAIAPPPAPTPAPPARTPSRWSAWTEPDRTYGMNHQVGTLVLASPTTFRQVGRSLTTLILATLGGIYTRRRYEALNPEPAP